MSFASPLDSSEMKRCAAEAAVGLLDSDMTVGLGTGSTVFYFLQALHIRLQKGLRIRGLASSLQTEQIAQKLGIPLLSPLHTSRLDIAIDGADGVDPFGNLLKGGGGALLREKIVAHMADQFVVIVDEKKCVESFRGAQIAVEFTSFGSAATLEQLYHLGICPKLRYLKPQHPWVTDHGNWIADCTLSSIVEDPWPLVSRIESLPGVFSTGYFREMATHLLIGRPNGEVTTIVY